MNVNDGVCNYEECCDGSDEWAKVGGTKCEDRCKDVGKEWRKQDEQRKRSLGAASKKRRELAAEAEKLSKEVADRIETLQTLIQGDQLKIEGLESQLAEVERQERGRVIKKPEKGGTLGVLVQLARDRIGELRDSVVELRRQRDLGRERVAELEAILSTFKEEYNPNFNDEGVKRAVRSWEDYAAKDKAEIDNPAYDRDLDEIAKPDGESGAIDWSEWERQEDSDVDVLYKFEAYLPPSFRDWLDKKLRNLRIILIENGILAPSRDSGESKDLENARSALKAAQDVIESNQKQLQEHREDLAKDYGADSVFRALKGQCVEKDSGEYTYELCWLTKTTQKSKKGGGYTNMGSFVSFDVITVDEELPPDGKGLGKGEKVALKYENGQHCWNGPNRSSMIILACAEKNELWRIVEEEKCVYRMEAGSPAVCGIDVSNDKQQTKDEL
ncbi:uncharacterized protein KY384_005399 [Bacidia gigantensis]|uniref:uncharacterized protein n=1 Tax=Bacidia gigantensis TaxID=2732470 RepID=UPI001D03EDCC|nr:uncharacterized protein KY384_005399 [Bacidia gigantensis]KAG8529918.1 hypothetical protein KY384_005399 [Bacidia gigantensis]